MGLRAVVILLMLGFLIFILGVNMGADVGYYLFNFIQDVKRPSLLESGDIMLYEDSAHNIWSLNIKNSDKNLLIDHEEIKKDGSAYIEDAKLSPDESSLIYITGHTGSSLKNAYLFRKGKKYILMQIGTAFKEAIISQDIIRKIDCNSLLGTGIDQVQWSDKGGFIATVYWFKCEGKPNYWVVDIFDNNGRFLENFYTGTKEQILKIDKWISPSGEESLGADLSKISGTAKEAISPDGLKEIRPGKGMFKDYTWGMFLMGSEISSYDLYIRNIDDEGKDRLWYSDYNGTDIDETLWSPDSKQILFKSRDGVFVLTIDGPHKPARLFSRGVTVFEWR